MSKKLTEKNGLRALLNDNKKSLLPLLLAMYAFAVVLRTIMSYVLLQGPIVVIDESLYTNIARSLAWEGKLLYRSQEIYYPYIFYPILLVPVYWLNALLGGDVYRWVQIYNALLICSSLFPAYLLAKNFTSDRKKAVMAAVFTLLMPDMQMCTIEMSESAIWPLALWLMFFAWKMFTEDKTRWGGLVGLFSGLMFFSKPGAIAMGGGILISALVALRKDKRKLKNVCVGIVVALLVMAMVFALYVFVFGYDFDFLGLYDKQTSDWEASHFLLAIEATVLLAFLFVFACGGVGGILPYTEIQEYSAEKKRMLWCATVGLIAAILGTSFLVTPYKWDGSFTNIPLHTRYIAMYVPVWLIFTLDIGENKRRMGKWFVLCMIIFTVLSIFPGVRMGFVTGDTSDIDSMALATFLTNSRNNGTVNGTIFTIATVLFSLYALLSKKRGFNGSFRKGFIAFMVAGLLYNNICNFVVLNVADHTETLEDANQLNEMLEQEDSALGITQRYYNDIYTYWQECHLNKPMQQVTTDQIIKCTTENNGVYEPFVPINQSPNESNGLTPDTTTFVLGQTIAEHIELSEYTESVSTDHGIYTVVHITEGQRWADTMMYGLNDNRLSEGAEARVYVIGGREGEMTVTMDIFPSYDDEVLTVTQDNLQVSIEIPSRQTVTFTLPTSNSFKISTTRDIDIYSYSTSN